ncbi:formylglycine-generating enzyme family protein [Candidatus Bipolaricaulota bacterium]
MIEMINISGGGYMMGDVLGEGAENERPVHHVMLDSFYLAPCAVTVGKFRAFVEDAGYRTLSESPEDVVEQTRIFELWRDRKLPLEELMSLYDKFLSYGGTFRFTTDKPGWGLGPGLYWDNPGFAQADDHPVVAIGWNDAISYCNWLSRKADLPEAYDLDTGRLRNEHGVAEDTTTVRGYRLPTEAEWEFAAREGGKAIRFGNGQDIARPAEINFRAEESDLPFSETGEYRKATVPVASFKPNGLGIYNLSGNAWEFVSDAAGDFQDAEQVNPHQNEGDQRILRGGRWGGDANEARVYTRSGYSRSDRCNNSGFRIARSDIDQS